MTEICITYSTYMLIRKVTLCIFTDNFIDCIYKYNLVLVVIRFVSSTDKNTSLHWRVIEKIWA